LLFAIPALTFVIDLHQAVSRTSASTGSRCRVAVRGRRLDPDQGNMPRGARKVLPTLFAKGWAMDINAAIFGRRSVREYTAQSIDAQAIQPLINAAVHAPNAVNQQPWAFTVVRDRSVLARVSDNAKRHMLATMPARYSDYFRPRLTDPDFDMFYRAPVLIVISATEQGPWIVEDCALAAQNLMLAAYAAGLGTCWIGFAQGFLNTPEGKKALDLPSAWVTVAPIIVGYPKAAPAAKPRNEPMVKWIG
jgi:nitroreductase